MKIGPGGQPDKPGIYTVKFRDVATGRTVMMKIDVKY